MRINEIFADLLNGDLTDQARTRAQDLVRKIVVGRRSLTLSNDVMSLYQDRHRVARHFGVCVSDMDVLWRLPAVHAHMREFLMDGHTDDSDDSDYCVSQSENEDDATSGSDSGSGGCVSIAATDRVVTPPPVTVYLRRLYWFGLAGSIMHGIVLIVTTCTLLAILARTETAPHVAGHPLLSVFDRRIVIPRHT